VVTGLAPGGRYDTTVSGDAGKTLVRVQVGTARQADAGGTLSW
jgi:hypothetical protein